EVVGDQSSYVGELLRCIRAQSSEILLMLHKQQYAKTFCNNLVDQVTNTYILSIVQCRPITEIGAEQVSTCLAYLSMNMTDKERCYWIPTSCRKALRNF